MGFDRRGKKCWFAPASARLQSPGAAAQSLEARASACRGRGRGRRTKRVGACRARPTGGRREGAEGVWQWFLANTKDPLATHFPSAPLSPPQINTLVVFIPGCLVSLSVGVTVCSEGQTRRRAVCCSAPPLLWGGRDEPAVPRRWPVGRGGDGSSAPTRALAVGVPRRWTLLPASFVPRSPWPLSSA